jgi:glycosyltransferase involved in cell wall biosynthesis
MNPMTKISLSVVTVTFNEELNIQKVIDKYFEICNKFRNKINFELIICDDASQDNTVQIINKNKFSSNIKLIRNERNMGAGFSFRRTIEQVEMDYVLLIDSDNQYDLVEAVNKFSKIYDNEVDIYFGFRDFSRIRTFEKVGPILTTIIYKKIFSNKLKDYSCVVKVLRSQIIKSIKLEAIRMNYSNELTVVLLSTGQTFKDFQMGFLPREKGLSSTKFFTDGIRRINFTIYLWLKSKLMKNGIITNFMKVENE